MDDLAALRDSHDGLLEQLEGMGPVERAEVRQRMLANLVTCQTVLACLDVIEGCRPGMAVRERIAPWPTPASAPPTRPRREPRLPRF
jgi:hypothetical protein